jgi:anthranilate synthase component II
MMLLIDHYDSFTYNLYQLFGELGEEVEVVRYDKITLSDIKVMNPKAIILSPGPGNPEEIIQTIQLIDAFYKTIPIIGICLGHQAIGYAFGATISSAKQVMHGKTSNLSHNRSSLFSNLPQPLEVMRYHSLVIKKDTLPSTFKTIAISMDDHEIMAIQHQEYPLFGLQFHPESIGTKEGKQLLINFLNVIKEEPLNEKLSTTIS